MTAAPQAGRANQALIKLATKSWRPRAKSAITLSAGAKDRTEILLLTGDGAALGWAALERALSRWLADQGAAAG